MTDSDETRSLRNFYYLGLFSQAINEAEGSDNPGAKIFMYRAMLESNVSEVFKQIDDKAAMGLQAIKLLGTYRSAAADQKELAFETLTEWLGDEMLKEDATLQLMAAQMYFEEGNFKESLKLVHSAGEDLEKMAMQVQIYLKIDRIDLAAKAARVMGDIDDDDVLTQLATSWLYVAQGGEKIMEASFLLQELVDKFGKSVSILSSQAVCQIHLGNFTDAMNFLKQARSLSMQGGGKIDATTLINYITCLQSLQKPREIVDKIEGELRENYPKHPYLANLDAMTDMFDHHAKTYAI